jgi:DNA-binding beta-propeller fold protein YncE
MIALRQSQIDGSFSFVFSSSVNNEPIKNIVTDHIKLVPVAMCVNKKRNVLYINSVDSNVINVYDLTIINKKLKDIKLEPDRYTIRGLAYDEIENILYVCGFGYKLKSIIAINPTTGVIKRQWGDILCSSICFDPTTRLIYVAHSLQDYIGVYTPDGECVNCFDASQPFCISVSDELLYASCDHNQIIILNKRNGNLINTISFLNPGHLCTSSDYTKLYIRSENNIYIIDTSTNKTLNQINLRCSGESDFFNFLSALCVSENRLYTYISNKLYCLI